MSANARPWRPMLRAFGASLVQLLRAELAQLERDFERSWESVAASLGLLAAAAALAFWSVALLGLVALYALSVWLPAWAAALVLFVIFAGAAAACGLVAAGRLRRLESPLGTLRRRASDHLDWWQHRFEDLDAESGDGLGEADREPPVAIEEELP